LQRFSPDAGVHGTAGALNLVTTLAGGGRVFSTGVPHRSHITFLFFEEKTARPGHTQARRSSQKRCGLVHTRACLESHFVDRFAGARGRKNRTKKITQIQSRKLHENLVGAQPAQLTFALFFAR
jgi:hypothetical protein